MNFAQFARPTKRSQSSSVADEALGRVVGTADSIAIVIQPSVGEPRSARTAEKNAHWEAEAPVRIARSDPTAEDDLIVCSSRKIPVASYVDLIGHSKAVTCVSVEPSGNRVVTGSLDYSAKFFDFGGMDSRHQSFKSIEAEDSHVVVSISHSPTGDRFVLATGSCQPRVFDREGNELIKFVRGDMYLRDLSNTKGHTMEVTGAQWHPFEKDVVLTCSLDGSLRVWNLLGDSTFGQLVNAHVLKVRGPSSASRLGVTCCAYSPSGTKMVGGASDGSVHVWLERKVYSRPDLVLRADCCSKAMLTAVTVAVDSRTLAMRSDTGHVVLWDIHNSTTAKTELKVISGLNNDNQYADVVFSPDGSILCCGTSPLGSSTGSAITSSEKTSSDRVGASKLHFYDVSGPSISPILVVVIGAGLSVLALKWHASTNQLLCALSSGAVRVFFDPLLSKKGALLSAHKAPKRVKDMTDFAAVGEIFNPLALPMYRTEMPGDKRKKKAALQDPYLCKIPEKPLEGGPGTRPNNSFFFTNYMMKDRVVDNTRATDPREALMQAAEEAQKDPKIFGRAYGSTQPTTLLHDVTFEEEREEFKQKQKKFN